MMALERLLEWPEIARSPQLGRFLGYIVQRTLDGDEQSIKAYSIAVDVFGRGADFDPQADPIVRVQARRLRALLDDYYNGPGLGDVIQIRLPVGRYIPEFVAAPDASRPEIDAPAVTLPPHWNFVASWFALAFIALVLAMLAFGLTSWRPSLGTSGAAGAVQRPTITVVEFQNLAGATSTPPQVAGLAIELVTDLEQFGTIGPRYGGGGEANVPVGNLPTSDYVLTGIVRLDGDLVEYSAILTDSRTGSVVWDHALAMPVAEAMRPDVLDKVSRSLSLVLGSSRGPLHLAAREYLASVALSASDANPYLCRMLFDHYRETGGPREAARSQACYASLPEADRETAPVLAAMASILAEQGDGNTDEPAMNRASANLGRAIGLDPINGFIWEQQGRMHQTQRALVAARADFSSSVQLNPASLDALAAYARLLAFSGNLDDAESMARDAAEGSPNPPPWYQGVLALLALRDGRFAEAIAYAEVYAQADRELGPILAIVAAQNSGNGGVVTRYLPQVLDVAGFRANGVLPQLRLRISDESLIDAIRSALRGAGVPEASLIEAF